MTQLVAQALLPASIIRAPEQFGKILYRWRKARKLTQDEVADKAGVTQKTISVVEGGKKKTELATILAICAVLDLEIVVRGKPQPISTPARLKEIFGSKR
jgi:transcriptional regulator with XRE-family HTH domain